MEFKRTGALVTVEDSKEFPGRDCSEGHGHGFQRSPETIFGSVYSLHIRSFKFVRGLERTAFQRTGRLYFGPFKLLKFVALDLSVFGFTIGALQCLSKSVPCQFFFEPIIAVSDREFTAIQDSKRIGALHYFLTNF